VFTVVGEREPITAYLLDWWARDYDPQPQWESWQAPHRLTLPSAIEGIDAGSVYEIGCGAGPNLRLLREHLPHVHLAGSDINPRHASWAARHLSIAVDVASIPHDVDGSWGAVLTCYTLAYCEPHIVEQQLARIDSPYLIVMEPWGDGACYQATKQSCPRWHHDWRLLTGDTGWRLEWKWPVPSVNGLSSLAIFQKHPG
jgi:SAM-dependent methyltransferase